MKILIEHPVFIPYTGAVTGGTERFVHLAAKALSQDHDVQIFASQDSTTPCIKSSAFSTAYQISNKRNTNTKLWYNDLQTAAEDFDVVILNSSLTYTVLLNHPYKKLFSKSIYFNHNFSNWFLRGFSGKNMQLIARLFRSQGGKTFYFSDENKLQLENFWDGFRDEIVACVSAKRKDEPFLELELFDGKFNQAVFPDDAVPVQAPQGYLIAVGRDVPDKRLNQAKLMAKKLKKELRVYSDLPHDELMKEVAGADCLLLSSRNETFSIAAFEAMCHGVPVSYIDEPPALQLYPELGRSWGDINTNTLEERQRIQEHLKQTYSLEQFKRRLVEVMEG